jgi:hypothetical protein
MHLKRNIDELMARSNVPVRDYLSIQNCVNILIDLCVLIYILEPRKC